MKSLNSWLVVIISLVVVVIVVSVPSQVLAIPTSDSQTSFSVLTLYANAGIITPQDATGQNPTMKLRGPNPQILTVGSTFVEQGVTAKNNLGKDITSLVKNNASVIDTSIPGKYVEEYSVTDKSGLDATIFRTVEIQPLNFQMNLFSPNDVKPSFGEQKNMIFHNGLKINNKVYDLGKFQVEVPKNIIQVGRVSTIIVKQQPQITSFKWQHVAIYMNFADQNDLQTSTARLILADDKTSGPSLYDPDGYVKNFKVIRKLDTKFVYTTFSFKATKLMPDSNMLVQAWDEKGRVNIVHVNGAVQFGPDIPVEEKLPNGFIKFTDYYALRDRLISDGLDKPKIMAHIQGNQSISSGVDGLNVSWLYNPDASKLIIVIADKYGVERYSQTESLNKIKYSHWGFCNLPVFQSSCTTMPVYVDTPDGKKLIDYYRGMFTEQMKTLGLLHN